ncbi:MAG: hypothetical protein IJ641_09885 [Lachnospiraceae bacterium]|nr:hypothetical protein [Lachnospiraceae bacterium]
MSDFNEKINTKLDEDDLENVSGGVIFNATGIIGADSNNPWELLDDTNGSTLGRFPTRDDAIAAAGAKGKNHMEINWDQVQQLRGQR